MAVTPAAPDTVAALHRYFVRSRRHGRVLLGVGAGIAVIGYTTAAVNDKGGSLPAFLAGVLGVVAGAPVLVVGVVTIVAHSRSREQYIVRALEAHRLPRRWVRRALQPEFAQAISPR